MNRRIWDIVMAVLFLAAVACAVNIGLGRAAEASGSVMAEESGSNTCEDNKKVIVIDPGHGGSDPGKVGVNGVNEADINLSISFELKKLLEQEGYSVVLTRNDEKGRYTESDVNKKAADMRKRCEIISANCADVVVSIHQNSYSEASVKGAQVFYYTHSAKGKELAGIIQQSLKANADPDNNRQCKANDSYYMLIHTPCPTVIVECGFLSNPLEAEKLSQTDYQHIIAQAVVWGINEYFGST